jgi:hypothetical protein
MLSHSVTNQTYFADSKATAGTNHATMIPKSEKPPKGKIKKRKGENWLRVTSQIKPY